MTLNFHQPFLNQINSSAVILRKMVIKLFSFNSPVIRLRSSYLLSTKIRSLQKKIGKGGHVRVTLEMLINAVIETGGLRGRAKGCSNFNYRTRVVHCSSQCTPAASLLRRVPWLWTQNFWSSPLCTVWLCWGGIIPFPLLQLTFYWKSEHALLHHQHLVLTSSAEYTLGGIYRYLKGTWEWGG